MLTFDMRDFQRLARGIERLEKQVPFALSKALNASAEKARTELIDTTWAQHITVRDPNFLKNALTTRGARATKRKLRVEIYDKLERASLALHDQGGRKLPRGQTLAIPNRPIAARRGSKGVPKGLRPRALSRSFATKWKTGDTLIFQQTGSYRKAGPPNKAGKRRPAKDNRHLKLAYVLKSSVPVKADVPFHADFERVMRRQMPTQFGVAMVAAVNTSLRK